MVNLYYPDGKIRSGMLGLKDSSGVMVFMLDDTYTEHFEYAPQTHLLAETLIERDELEVKLENLQAKYETLERKYEKTKGYTEEFNQLVLSILQVARFKPKSGYMTKFKDLRMRIIGKARSTWER